VNVNRVFGIISELASSSLPISEKMGRVIAVCSQEHPHSDWSDLSVIPYDEDSAKLHSWLPRVMASEPPPFKIRGLWFGIGTFLVDGRETADMHVIGSNRYDPNDRSQDWAVRAGYRPENGVAESMALDQIHRIAYRSAESLENDAEWSLCLAYAVFAVSQLLRSATPALFGSDTDVGVVVGFDEGDSLTLGYVTVHGLVA